MTAIRQFTLGIAAVVAGVWLSATPVAAQPCAGDCGGDGSVTVAELVLGVSIALGDALVADCLPLDLDGDGAVAINELLAAVRRALQGCDAARSPTSTPTAVDTAPATHTPTATGTPLPTAVSEPLVAVAQVASLPLVRLLDAQATVGEAVSVAGAARRTAHDGSGGASGCQHLDCELSGSQEVCCSDIELSQTFDRCVFTDDDETVTLSGQFVVKSASSVLCSGALPLDADFVVTLANLTHVRTLPDGRFTHTAANFRETYEVVPSACTLSPPDFFGIGIRGTGRRRIAGLVQRYAGDGAGHVSLDTFTGFNGVRLVVDARSQADECLPTATMNGVINVSDFRRTTQLSTVFADVTLDQQTDGTELLVNMNGTISSDCVGDVTLATTEALRLPPGAACFTSGRFAADVGGATVSGLYTGSGGLDLDIGDDGSIEHHFAACTDATVAQCTSIGAPLCGACTELAQCHIGLGCFACADNCSGETKRCALSDTAIACGDGTF